MTNATSTAISEVNCNVAKLAFVGFGHEVRTIVERNNPLYRKAQADYGHLAYLTWAITERLQQVEWCPRAGRELAGKPARRQPMGLPRYYD